MAVFVIMACVAFTVIAGAAVVTAFARFGRGGLSAAAFSMAGMALCWTWPVAVIGVAEGFYTAWPGLPTVLGVIGLVGLACVIAGACLALRRDTREQPGLCKACGYDLKGAVSAGRRCPECGQIGEGFGGT